MRSHRGQRANTRSLGMITRLNDKIDAAALKYRLARNAVFLLAHHLGKDVPIEDFPYLRKKDTLRCGMTPNLNMQKIDRKRRR